MAKLTTIFQLSVHRMILDKTPANIIANYGYDVSHLLPPQTEFLFNETQEIQNNSGLNRTFILKYDAPFFSKDFEFEVFFSRKILTDGEKIHYYDVITELKPIEKT